MRSARREALRRIAGTAALVASPLVLRHAFAVEGADSTPATAAGETLPRPTSPGNDPEDRILSLDPEHISAADVRDVLQQAPAPRIIGLQGSFPLITMRPFAEYLIALGYPEERLRTPPDDSMSLNSFTDSEQLA